VGAAPAPVPGPIYVFQQDEGGSNNWGLVTSFAPPDPFTTNGWAIAIDGDTAAIRINASLVYLFERDQGGVNNWGTAGFVRAPSTGSAGNGGQGTIALEANTLVVGAWKNGEHGPQAGAAYVYYRDNGGSNNWGQVATLFSSQPAETDQFGWCVAIAGDFVTVGARGVQPGGGPLLGSVHVFQRHAGGQDNWGQIAYVNGGSDTEPDDGIGRFVGLAGDTLLVAAMHDIGQAGSVYVFEIGGPDCNSNILCDPIEIANGTSDDTDGNGVPDDCQCWDCAGDNNDNVGIVDFLALLAQWGQVGASCDFDGDGVGITDFLTLLANWGPCP